MKRRNDQRLSKRARLLPRQSLFAGMAMILAMLPGCAAPDTSATTTAAGAVPVAETGAQRKTPVVAGRPARVYIWAGFDEATCAARTPALAVAVPPTNGTVTFKPGQSTKIEHSRSGKCIGQTLPGTGIYYTAKPGATGRDQFSVTATLPNEAPVTQNFTVTISN